MSSAIPGREWKRTPRNPVVLVRAVNRMGQLIDLEKRREKPSDNLICLEPWEFRRARWETPCFVQMRKAASERLESEYRSGAGSESSVEIPVHFSLKGGAGDTIRALFANRENEERMRRILYLTGLMDCMINQVNEVLRTDLLRGMYREISLMKEELNTHWYGRLDQVLIPIDPSFFDERKYRASLRRAQSMKALYSAIRKGTREMFRVLSVEYVFYCPNSGRRP